jgi:hypothetical protein
MKVFDHINQLMFVTERERLERLARDKHSSSLGPLVSYEESEGL